MKELKDFFNVVIANDRMSAEIHCEIFPKKKDLTFNEESVYQFLKDYNVVYGIDQNLVQKFAKNKLSFKDFPLTIAKGIPAKNGKDGTITYEFNYSSEIERGSNWNFREVMRIPSVTKNQKLATITLPTKGQDGMNVQGKIVKAKPGRPVNTKAGKNVQYKEENLSFYSTIEGQVSITDRRIMVHPLYEVNETLSMKTGNLDFIGSIIIKGDVPTGYTVKAKGDIKIFGIVEAATIIAGGSIYVSEGLAGLQKGIIKAEENIHIGYINQGIAQAKNSIYVENSIIHSEITARNEIVCQRGNIIGGSLSAGKLIEAKDIGNRLSTKTNINLGVNKAVDEEIAKLETTKKELTSTLEKLTMLGKRLKNRKLDAKTRITLLRQRNSQLKTVEKIKEIDDKLAQMNAFLGSEKEATLVVRNNIYPNVIIAFGKYKHKIDRMYSFIQANLDQNEISIRPLRE